MSCLNKQRGVALITALLIVAIVAVVAALLSLGQQVWLRQTQNLADLSQSDILRGGAFEFAALALEEEGKASGAIDSYQENTKWHEPKPLQVSGIDARIVVQAEDAQARFNVNNLRQGEAINARQLQAYRELLALLNLPPELADTLRDWIDADSNTEPNGAEDLDYYLNQNPPRRTANRPLTSIEELRLIKGYDKKAMDRLRPYVIALPSTEPLKVNVNTATAPVIAALAKISLAQADAIAKTPRNFPSVDAFLQQSGINNPRVADSFDVVTSYFIVSATVLVGRTQRKAIGIIERPSGGSGPARVLRSGPSPIEIDLNEDKKS